MTSIGIYLHILPDLISILVLVSIRCFGLPGTGGLKGMIVGTEIEPAVILPSLLQHCRKICVPNNSQKLMVHTWMQLNNREQAHSRPAWRCCY